MRIIPLRRGNTIPEIIRICTTTNNLPRTNSQNCATLMKVRKKFRCWISRRAAEFRVRSQQATNHSNETAKSEVISKLLKVLAIFGRRMIATKPRVKELNRCPDFSAATLCVRVRVSPNPNPQAMCHMCMSVGVDPVVR